MQIDLPGDWSVRCSLDWGHTEQVAGSAVEHRGKHPQMPQHVVPPLLRYLRSALDIHGNELASVRP